MSTEPSISEGEVLVCIPTYNERENITRIVSQVLRELDAAHILIIDDNSPDDTGKLADGLASVDHRIHVLHRPEKEGLGCAYRAAYRWALPREYFFIFEFDADGSHAPCDIPILLDALKDHDMAVGSRFVPEGKTEDHTIRKMISRSGSAMARRILRLPVLDLTSGFLGLRRRTLETIEIGTLKSRGYAFQIELKHRVYLAGLRIKEVPITFSKRRQGESKMNTDIIFEGLRYLMHPHPRSGK